MLGAQGLAAMAVMVAARKMTGGGSARCEAARRDDDKPRRLLYWGAKCFGNDGVASEKLPKPCSLADGKKILSMSMSEHAGAACDEQGRVWVWGDVLNKDVEEAKPAKIPGAAKKVACNLTHTYALLRGGSVVRWPHEDPSKTELVPIPSGWWGSIVGSGKVVDMEAAHATFACVTRGGTAYAMGDGSKGQLGHGDCSSSSVPVKMLLPEKERAKTVAVGKNHSVILTETGNVYACGANNLMQLGQAKEETIKKWKENEEDSSKMLSPVTLPFRSVASFLTVLPDFRYLSEFVPLLVVKILFHSFPSQRAPVSVVLFVSNAANGGRVTAISAGVDFTAAIFQVLARLLPPVRLIPPRPCS
eukprot:109849-Hanusia_phi.AAC.1